MTKKPEKKGRVLEILAGDVSRTRWLLGLNTAVRGFKELQSDIANARDSFAAEFATRQISQSAVNRENGRALKKPGVTRAALETFREEFVYREGRERGWKKAACLTYGIDRNTLAARLKENE